MISATSGDVWGMGIIYSKKALKFLKAQNRTEQQRIVSAIEKIPKGDIIKLHGLKGYRLRVGNYRVIYNINGIVVDIMDIGNRGKIYKWEVQMSVVKERILGAITVMSEEDSTKVWEFIEMHFGFPEEVPTDEEIRIIEAYENGDPEYQPYITHEQLKKELGIWSNSVWSIRSFYLSFWRVR